MIRIIGIIFITLCVSDVNSQVVSYYEKCFGGSTRDRYPTVIQSSTGILWISGASGSPVSGSKTVPLCSSVDDDLWLIKTDLDFNEIQQVGLGGMSGEFTPGISFNNGRNAIFIACESRSDSSCQKTENNNDPNLPFGDYWTIMLDTNGNVLNDFTWGSSSEETGAQIIQLQDGKLVVAGASRFDTIDGDKSVMGFGSFDYWIVQFDSSGNKLWDQVYGGTGIEYYNLTGRDFKVLPVDSGKFYLFGCSESPVSGNITHPPKGGFQNMDLVYWLLDTSGTIEFQNRIGGVGFDRLGDAIITTDGGILLVGYSDSPAGFDVSQSPIGLSDCWIVKLDSTGMVSWDKRYGGTDTDFCHSVASTPDGGYIIGASTRSPAGFDITEPGYGNYDYWILKIDSLGNKIWDKRFGGPGEDWLRNIIILPDTSIIVSGHSNYGSSPVKSFPGYGFYDYWLIRFKYDENATGNTDPSFSVQVPVYPNPSSGTVKVPAFMAGSDLQLVDMSGREARKVTVPAHLNVDLSSIPEGLYLMKFRTKNGHYFAKWLKTGMD